jgi:4-amino-4-deoxy-L-arabinose transferase-like glycosyltransferase
MENETPAVAQPSDSAAASGSKWWRHPRLPFYGVLVLALAHLVWVGANLSPAIMSPDANGYVVQARLIAEAGRTSFTTQSPVQFVGMHWLETTDGLFHSRYPAGLPLVFAAAWKIGGLGALVWVNPVLASATLVLVFFLARRFTGGWTALLAAAVVATVPVTNQHALDADAHVAATFFLVGGVLALLRFGETRATAMGLLAGVLLGIVPTVRYPEALVGVAMGAWLLWQVRPILRVWPAVLGAALPIGALCVHNAAAYGAFWRTGYALTNEQTGFGIGYFFSHALGYLQALGGQGLALFFAFGAAGVAALAVERRTRGAGVLFAGIVTPLVLLYMAYYFGGGGPGAGLGAAVGNLRFLVPTFPFFAIAGAWLLGRMAEQLGAAGQAALVAVAALQLIVGLGASAQMLKQSGASIAAAAGVRKLAEKEIPAGAVVIVERQLAESLDATGQWKIVEEAMAGGGLRAGGPMGMAGGGAARGGMPGGGFPPMGGRGGMSGGADQPSPQQVGKNRAQQERYAGLGATERSARVWADIAAWAGDQPVYWFARSLDGLDNALPDDYDYKSIAEIDAPSMMGPGGGGGGGPGGGAPGMGPMMAGGRGPGMAGGPGMLGPRAAMAGGGGATKLRVVRVIFPAATKAKARE